MSPLTDLELPTPLLGGLSPARFMQRHWHKKPLLVRQAWPADAPPVSRAQMFSLMAQEHVESRLIVKQAGAKGGAPRWTLKHGPLARRALPPLSRPGWTALLQGLDLHLPAARELLERFRFVPDARLDDVMVSYASDGGGVGPHFDSYDVFLLQTQGRRRWRIGRLRDPQLLEGLPLKILANFEPEQEWELEAGDMLYLPPRWAHDGLAVGGDCMTCSIGFRSPARSELVADVLARIADTQDQEESARYKDPRQAASAHPAALPAELMAWGLAAVRSALASDEAITLALGEALSEPKPTVGFAPSAEALGSGGLSLDPGTRMMYDARHVYVNGASWRIGGQDARALQRLADRRHLGADQVASASPALRAWLQEALEEGWLHLSEPRRDGA